MAIRIPSTSLPQQPEQRSAVPGAVVPVQAIGNPAAAGAGLASQAGSLAAKLLQEQRDKEVVARLSEVDVERRKTDAEILDGYHSLQGKGAVEQRAKVMSALEQNAKRVRESIKDPEVARLWKGQDQELLLQSSLAADRHYRQQSQIWQADTQKARADQLQLSLERVAFAEGYDPATGKLSDEAERTRSLLLSTIGELGTVMGWSAERIQNEQQKADSQALTGVADQLLAEERFQEAGAVLQAHRDKIDPQTAARIEAVVRRGRVDDVSRRLTNDVLAAAQQSLTRTTKIGVGAAEIEVPVQTRPDHDAIAGVAAAQVEKLFADGKIGADVADNAISRIERTTRAAKQQQAADDTRLLDQAEATLIANPNASWQDLPATTRQQLADAGMLPTIVAFNDSGNRYSTRPAAEDRLQSASKAELAAMDPEVFGRNFRGLLSPGRLQYWQAKIGEAKGTATPDQARIASLETYKRNAARVMGILPKDGSKASAQQELDYDNWQLDFDKRVLEPWQVNNRRKASDEDVHKLLDLEVASKVQRDVKHWYGASATTEFLGRIPKGEAGDAYVVIDGVRTRLGDVPSTEWDRIAAFLSGKGEQPTPEAVVGYWRSIGSPGAPAPSPAQVDMQEQAQLDALFEWFNSPGASRKPPPAGSLEVLKRRLQQGAR